MIRWQILLLSTTVGSSLALNIQFDYSYDTQGFFAGANASRRAVLEAAAERIERRVAEVLPGLVPIGGNSWSLGFPHPGTGQAVTLENPSLPADTVVIYVGGRPRSDGFIAYAEYSYNWNGDGNWVALWQARDGANSFQSIGGSISFNSDTTWYFDPDVRTVESFSGYDFFSLAQHEIAHLLGFTDGAAAFRTRVSSGTFVGLNAVALYGAGVPLASGLDHFGAGIEYRGFQANMTPFFSTGTRTPFTELDFAVLNDIGYATHAPEEVRLVQMARSGNEITLAWTGGVGPFAIESNLDLSSETWTRRTNPLPAAEAATVMMQSATEFFRLIDLGR
ncbi:MAG TPA: hypothetical protein VF773_16065 [Verrucomicrobiae bacterium]